MRAAPRSHARAPAYRGSRPSEMHAHTHKHMQTHAHARGFPEGPTGGDEDEFCCICPIALMLVLEST